LRNASIIVPPLYRRFKAGIARTIPRSSPVSPFARTPAHHEEREGVIPLTRPVDGISVSKRDKEKKTEREKERTAARNDARDEFR